LDNVMASAAAAVADIPNGASLAGVGFGVVGSSPGAHRNVVRANGSSVECVLGFVDRQIERVLRRGVGAVEADLVEEDRAAAGAVLERLPAGICSAVITQVARRGRYTVVKVRFTTTGGKFTMITAWAFGPKNRPWVTGIDTLETAPGSHVAQPGSSLSPVGLPQSPPAFPHDRPLIIRRWQRQPKMDTAGSDGSSRCLLTVCVQPPGAGPAEV
jgi:hypothetical protein